MFDIQDGHQPFGSPEAACWEGPRYEAARDQEKARHRARGVRAGAQARGYQGGRAATEPPAATATATVPAAVPATGPAADGERRAADSARSRAPVFGSGGGGAGPAARAARGTVWYNYTVSRQLIVHCCTMYM